MKNMNNGIKFIYPKAEERGSFQGYLQQDATVQIASVKVNVASSEED